MTAVILRVTSNNIHLKCFDTDGLVQRRTQKCEENVLQQFLNVLGARPSLTWNTFKNSERKYRYWAADWPHLYSITVSHCNKKLYHSILFICLHKTIFFSMTHQTAFSQVSSDIKTKHSYSQQDSFIKPIMFIKRVQYINFM